MTFIFFLPVLRALTRNLQLVTRNSFPHLFSFKIFLHFTISIREPQIKRHAVPMVIPATPFIILKNIPPFAQKYRTETKETIIAKIQSAIYLYIARILFPQYSLSYFDMIFHPCFICVKSSALSSPGKSVANVFCSFFALCSLWLSVRYLGSTISSTSLYGPTTWADRH